jgi:hypothetical protein
VFGVWNLLSGAGELGVMVLGVVGVFGDPARLASLKNTSVTLTVVGAALQVLVAALLVIFGVRMLRDDRRGGAVLARATGLLLVAQLAVDIMVGGLDAVSAYPVLLMLVMVVLESYLDPTLAEERRLQRALRKLEEESDEQERLAHLREFRGRAPFKLNFYNLFWTFVVASVVGLFVEEIYHLVLYHVWQDRAGMLFGPFSPIYGVGAVLMTLALNGIRNRNPLLIFVCSALIGGAFEYLVSWFMQFAFGITAWDYTGTFLSIGGRTNGFYMACWGLLGVAWIKVVLPVLFKLIYRVPWNWRYALTAVATALMLVDAAMTLESLNCWYLRESGREPATAVQAFFAEHFDDAYMENRFQTMTMHADSSARAD